MEYIKNLNTPIGIISIVSDGESIIKTKFAWLPETHTVPVLDRAAAQLLEYFKGERKEFDLPLSPAGTPFQKKVWQALLKIPYGKTASYGETAKITGNKNASRAVGGANNKNPIPVFIPCHRCIGRDGSLVGYGGGLHIKKFLLELEKSNI
jgi:methylated-DNA-[protein]-cysteine S-methyltransferase